MVLNFVSLKQDHGSWCTCKSLRYHLFFSSCKLKHPVSWDLALTEHVVLSGYVGYGLDLSPELESQFEYSTRGVFI